MLKRPEAYVTTLLFYNFKLWASSQGLTFKCSLQILSWVRVRALERPLQKLNINLLYPLQQAINCFNHLGVDVV